MFTNLHKIISDGNCLGGYSSVRATIKTIMEGKNCDAVNFRCDGLLYRITCEGHLFREGKHITDEAEYANVAKYLLVQLDGHPNTYAWNPNPITVD